MSATGTKPKKYKLVPKSTKRKFTRKLNTEKDVAQVARRVFTRKIKQYSELKFHVAHNVNANIPAIGAIVRLTDIPNTGTGDEVRIGDKVSMTSIRFNYKLALADATNFARVAIFQWCDSNNNGDPVVNNCIQNNTYPDISTWSHDSVQGKKIKVLYDRVHVLDSDDPIRVNYIMINKGFNRNLQFEGGGPSARGHLYLLLLSDSAAATHPTITYYVKTQFRDM